MNEATSSKPTSAADPAPALGASSLPLPDPPLSAGRSRRAILFFTITLLAVFASDLIIKDVCFRYVAGIPIELDPRYPGDASAIPPHEPVPVIPHLLSLRLTTNTGAVFGLGKGQQWLFVVVCLVAAGLIGRMFWKSDARDRVLHLCLALILAGAFGNLYDRIMFRAVRDMFWLLPGWNLPFDLSWPGGAREVYPWLFNVADAALVCGVLCLVVLLQFRPPGPEEKAPAKKAPR